MKKIRNFIYLAVLAFREMIAPPPNLKSQAQFANIGEGTFDQGMISMLPDAATSARYLLYKRGSDSNHVALCGAGDDPLGSSEDMVTDTTIPIAINIFGAKPGTVRVVTDGTIANGNFVTTGANGQATVATTGNLAFGRAIVLSDMTSAAGDTITVIHDLPSKMSF